MQIPLYNFHTIARSGSVDLALCMSCKTPNVHSSRVQYDSYGSHSGWERSGQNEVGGRPGALSRTLRMGPVAVCSGLGPNRENAGRAYFNTTGACTSEHSRAERGEIQCFVYWL
jgi:hypothetical protein